MKNDYLIKKLEALSQEKRERILIIKGILINQFKQEEDLEIVIYRGFSSSLTHPTEFNEQETTIPRNSKLLSAILIKAPMNLSSREIVKGPNKPEIFLNLNQWE